MRLAQARRRRAVGAGAALERPTELAGARGVIQRDGDEHRGASSTPAANSSPGRATTCEPPSRRCKRCSRQSRTDWRRPTSTFLRSREQIRGLSLLIDDLFELACIDAGALTLQLQQVQPREVVETCLRAVDAQARARNVRLEADVDQATPTIAAAPDKVERVLMNLLTNALRHTPTDGAVAVIVAPSERGIDISVEDTGTGLAASSRAACFDRFWKADDARPLRRRRRGPRPRDRTRARRGPRRHDLGRDATGRRSTVRLRLARRPSPAVGRA